MPIASNNHHDVRWYKTYHASDDGRGILKSLGACYQHLNPPPRGKTYTIVYTYKRYQLCDSGSSLYCRGSDHPICQFLLHRLIEGTGNFPTCCPRRVDAWQPSNSQPARLLQSHGYDHPTCARLLWMVTAVSKVADEIMKKFWLPKIFEWSCFVLVSGVAGGGVTPISTSRVSSRLILSVLLMTKVVLDEIVYCD